MGLPYGTPDRNVREVNEEPSGGGNVTLIAPLPLPVQDSNLPHEHGDWDYRAGVNGTVMIPAGGRILGIAASTSLPGATVSVNGGDAIPIIVPASGVGTLELAPRADLVGPTIDFVNTESFVIEFIT